MGEIPRTPSGKGIAEKIRDVPDFEPVKTLTGWRPPPYAPPRRIMSRWVRADLRGHARLRARQNFDGVAAPALCTTSPYYVALGSPQSCP